MSGSAFKVLAWQLAVLLAVVAAWELVVSAGVLNPVGASSPSRVAVALIEIVREPLFAKHVATTLAELVAGFAIGAGLGIAIGFVLAEWPMTERVP